MLDPFCNSCSSNFNKIETILDNITYQDLEQFLNNIVNCSRCKVINNLQSVFFMFYIHREPIKLFSRLIIFLKTDLKLESKTSNEINEMIMFYSFLLKCLKEMSLIHKIIEYEPNTEQILNETKRIVDIC